jgi:hypothetical protein
MNRGKVKLSPLEHHRTNGSSSSHCHVLHLIHWMAWLHQAQRIEQGTHALLYGHFDFYHSIKIAL